MSGWVPIPQVAIAAAGRDGRAAVLELYERAHRTGYAARPWTERELAEEWGVDRRLVVRLLERLASVGAVVIERAPAGARRPSTLRVLPAVVEGDVHQTRRQTRRQTPHQNASQNSQGSSVAFRESAPDPEPVSAPATAPATAPARAEVFARAQTEIEIKTDPLLRSGRDTTSPPPAARSHAPPAPQDPLPLALEPPQPDEDPPAAVPKWAKGHRVPPRVVVAAVVRGLTAIRGDAPDLQRCATEAAHVVKLQRATFTPWDELGEQLELVARWAQESHDLLASNDIRGIDARTGERWTTDRSRLVKTICVQGMWSDRLAAARHWEAGTGPTRPRARGEHSSSRQPRPTEAEVLARDPTVLDGVFGGLPDGAAP